MKKDPLNFILGREGYYNIESESVYATVAITLLITEPTLGVACVTTHLSNRLTKTYLGRHGDKKLLQAKKYFYHSNKEVNNFLKKEKRAEKIEENNKIVDAINTLVSKHLKADEIVRLETREQIESMMMVFIKKLQND